MSTLPLNPRTSQLVDVDIQAFRVGDWRGIEEGASAGDIDDPGFCRQEWASVDRACTSCTSDLLCVTTASLPQSRCALTHGTVVSLLFMTVSVPDGEQCGCDLQHCETVDSSNRWTDDVQALTIRYFRSSLPPMTEQRPPVRFEKYATRCYNQHIGASHKIMVDG